MRSVSLRLEDLQKVTIPIGFVGENEHTRVLIDCKKMYEEYPTAAASMTVRPPKGEAYPAVVVRDGDIVIWDVTDSDLIQDGVGEIQLGFSVSPVEARSFIGQTRIWRSIMPTGEIPEPLANFLTQAGAALTLIPETINQALADAKASGEFDGEDGFSPEISITDITGGHRLTVTTKDGSFTVDVMDGEKGDPGDPGDPGQPGSDGVSPTVAISDITGGHRVTVTDKSGDHSFDVMDGEKGDPGNPGQPGSDGVSPTVSISKSGKTTTVTITDKNGTHTATILDGEDGTTAIDDTAGAGDTDKVWSADKSASEISTLNGAIDGKPETKNTDEESADLDITDTEGNVLVRLKDGHIQTKEFNSEEIGDGVARSTNAIGCDIDFADTEGNVVLRLANGHIKTKNFDSTSLIDPYAVPSYYHANGYLKGKCDRLNQVARACAKKSDTFAFFTDLHWHLNAGKSPALLRYIKENTRIDKFFCGGDVMDFIRTEHDPYDAFTHYYKALNLPIYTAMGNHEYLVAQYGKEGRLYYTFNSVGRDRIGNFDRNYFYLDNPQSQIRYIFMNGFAEGESSWSYGYEQTQLDWLANVALDLETGWGAIVVTHNTHSIDFSDGSVPKDTHASGMLAVLDNYSGNGEVIAVISGHTHVDYLDSTTGGIPIIVTTCDKYMPWISGQTNMEPWLSDRVEGTITEQVIDLFVVDRDAKEITRVRVGCPIHYGTDPTTWTDYEDVTVSYDRS